MSVDDIVFLCKEKDRPEFKGSLKADKTKRRIVREELKRINSTDFRREDYSEIIGIISRVLGAAKKLNVPEELSEMFKELVAQFQIWFSAKTNEDLLARADATMINEAILQDPKLSRYLQDADRDSLRITNLGTGWKCQIDYYNGKQTIRLGFSQNTDHAKFKPKVSVTN